MGGDENYDLIEELDLSHKNLTELPILPKNLKRLNCGYNNLITLQNLPNGLIKLECNNNQIKKLTELPKNLVYLNISNNPIENTIINLNNNQKLKFLICKNLESGIIQHKFLPKFTKVDFGDMVKNSFYHYIKNLN